MFSVIIPRKAKNGRGESWIAYYTQELYCISRYNTKDGKLQYKTFFEDINEYAEKTNFAKLKKSPDLVSRCEQFSP